jgi:hypothetical protein
MKHDSDSTENNINLEDILKEKPDFVVKIGTKYVSKNSPEAIRRGSPRYCLSDTPFHFLRAMEANDAKRLFKGSVVENRN